MIPHLKTSFDKGRETNDYFERLFIFRRYVLRILQKYIQDLHADAARTHNEIDLAHCNFLLQIQELLEHNDFLTAQSQQIREFYKYMRGNIPFLPLHSKDGSSL